MLLFWWRGNGSLAMLRRKAGFHFFEDPLISDESHPEVLSSNRLKSNLLFLRVKRIWMR